ncbi:glycosyltransferase family 2 protein [Streptomyces sp. JNUCC 64]
MTRPTGNPLVSVVIPNYNYGRALELCLRAAQAQTYQPLEILLVDDCSTDDSVAVAEALGVRVVSTGVNSGVAITRNTGAAHARGEIVVFVDSDVAMEPDAVANAVAMLRENPRIGAVCGTYDAEPLIRDSLIEEYRCLHQYYWLAEHEGRIGTLHTAICAMPAAVFAEIGPFNPRLRHTEDGDYAARICRHYEVHSSTTVRGRHDHDDTWRVVLRKVFHRTRLHIPLYVRRRDLPGGIATGPRAGASVAALLALATLPAGLFGALWLLLPAALTAGSLLADTRLYAFVLRRRGIGFTAFFALAHFVVNAAIALGAGIGVIQWLTSGRFRRLYDQPPARDAGRTAGATA